VALTPSPLPEPRGSLRLSQSGRFLRRKGIVSLMYQIRCTSPMLRAAPLKGGTGRIAFGDVAARREAP